MRRILLVALLSFTPGSALATIFSTVRGIVHDPQHHPVPDIKVVLKVLASDYSQTTETDAAGEFHFDAVPLGQYVVNVSDPTFVADEQSITVLSGTSPILHLELKLPSQTQTVTVSADAGQSETVTPSSLVDRLQIQETPGASRSNSLSMVTNFVPGAYLTHDQLHIRGGHQVSWLIDGISIPNTNIASNLGPQIDPKDIDVLEIQRGSYSADYGDRTYGVFNVAPRTGFERNNEAELILSAGNFYQTDDQLNFGGHSNKFAYYGSVNGNRSNLGLQPPTPAVIHDAANGFGGFTSLIYNADPKDQFRFLGQSRRDFYQVPFDPNDPATQGQFLQDANRENDSFAIFSWVRTVSPGVLLTVSPFYHYNSANYESSLQDFPTSATEDRTSKYEGGQATISWVKKRNNLRAGFFGFAQQDAQTFGLLCHDPMHSQCQGDPSNPLSETGNPSGSQAAVYAEDQFKVASWLALNAGVRQTHFLGGVVENATSPRFGASLRIPKLNWVFRGFYGHFYQAPPLLTVSGPLLSLATDQNLGFAPLHGERDEEHQFGVTIPFHGWTLDADNFLTRATNFFDHNNFNNSEIFIPITIEGARINGWELTLRSPRIHDRSQIYLTYSNQLALGCGGINGGLTDFSFGGGCGLLDHDQRNTLHIGGQFSLPWHVSASTDVSYASGFTNGDAPQMAPGDHLQPHTTFDLALSREFRERLTVNLQAINVANRRVLLDNSFTFGGTHYLNPREVFVQLRYRFHY
ncbi:MAG TPA: TonB-dependent receptor [Candidatus Acidoferrum sp.]|nr:TonB-dependent receptor [Candidatus Acidoferrum sp.]